MMAVRKSSTSHLRSSARLAFEGTIAGRKYLFNPADAHVLAEMQPGETISEAAARLGYSVVARKDVTAPVVRKVTRAWARARLGKPYEVPGLTRRAAGRPRKMQH